MLTPHLARWSRCSYLFPFMALPTNLGTYTTPLQPPFCQLVSTLPFPTPHPTPSHSHHPLPARPYHPYPSPSLVPLVCPITPYTIPHSCSSFIPPHLCALFVAPTYCPDSHYLGGGGALCPLVLVLNVPSTNFFIRYVL